MINNQPTNCKGIYNFISMGQSNSFNRTKIQSGIFSFNRTKFTALLIGFLMLVSVSLKSQCVPPPYYIDVNSSCYSWVISVDYYCCDVEWDAICDGEYFNSCPNNNNTYYYDYDGDSFGDPAISIQAQSPPPGYVDNSLDCDDNYVGYEDSDGDGFGIGSYIPCGGVSNNFDCDDNFVGYEDNDGDGYGYGSPVPCGVANDDDCDDGNIGINPAATEVCNGVDDDCDGQTDEDILIYTTVVPGSYSDPGTWGGCLPPDPIPAGVQLNITEAVINHANTILTNNGLISVGVNGSFINFGTYQGKGNFQGNFINNGTVRPGNQ